MYVYVQLSLIGILLIAIKNSVQGMCCGMAHRAGKTTYNNSWQIFWGLKYMGKVGNQCEKKFIILHILMALMNTLLLGL
jgi:hypothetical protein